MLDDAEQISIDPMEEIRVKLRELQKRQTSDMKWDPKVDGAELLRLEGLLRKPLLEPITLEERGALKAQGTEAALSPKQQKLVISANEKTIAQRPPQPGGARR